MIKLLIISFLFSLGCKENTKLTSIQNIEISKKKEDNKNWSGKWIYIKKIEGYDVPEEQFTLDIVQNGKNVSGQYCAISNSGGKIDCESKKEYNFTGKIIDNKIFGTFYSFFGSSKDLGKVEISFVGKNIINWKIVKAPNGIFYAPNNCNLKIENNIPIQNKVNDSIFPLTIKKSENLEWIEDNNFTNYNLIYSLPKYRNYIVILAKNDLSDDEYFSLFTLYDNGKIIDSLKIAHSEDGYSNNRLITEFSIDSNYETTLFKYERKDYNKKLKKNIKYNISKDGKFINK